MAVNYKSGTPSPRRSTEKFAAPFHPEKAACTGQNQAESGGPKPCFFPPDRTACIREKDSRHSAAWGCARPDWRRFRHAHTKQDRELPAEGPGPDGQRM